jgi:hypothetical protein
MMQELIEEEISELREERAQEPPRPQSPRPPEADDDGPWEGAASAHRRRHRRQPGSPRRLPP